MLKGDDSVRPEKFKIDFVGIGSSKSGTTWIGHILQEHPQICLSEPKELFFFNDVLSFNTKKKAAFSNGLSWYKKFFHHCPDGKLKGEITNYYGIDPIAAIRLKDHNPDIKILFCLRHPVERVWSHYQFAKYFEKKEHRPPLQAIREENQYIRMSLYAQTLSLYLKHFKREQIFLIWFEEIANNPEKLAHDLFSFLGVDPLFKPASLHKKSNPARKSYAAFVQEGLNALKSIFIFLGLSGTIQKVKMAGMGRLIMKATSRPIRNEMVPVELREYILNQVKEDTRQLEMLTGKDLVNWLK